MTKSVTVVINFSPCGHQIKGICEFPDETKNVEKGITTTMRQSKCPICQFSERGINGHKNDN